MASEWVGGQRNDLKHFTGSLKDTLGCSVLQMARQRFYAQVSHQFDV